MKALIIGQAKTGKTRKCVEIVNSGSYNKVLYVSSDVQELALVEIKTNTILCKGNKEELNETEILELIKINFDLIVIDDYYFFDSELSNLDVKCEFISKLNTDVLVTYLTKKDIFNSEHFPKYVQEKIDKTFDTIIKC